MAESIAQEARSKNCCHHEGRHPDTCGIPRRLLLLECGSHGTGSAPISLMALVTRQISRLVFIVESLIRASAATTHCFHARVMLWRASRAELHAILRVHRNAEMVALSLPAQHPRDAGLRTGQEPG